MKSNFSARLSHTFFTATALKLAPKLVGVHVAVRQSDGSIRIGRIVETEAYCGPTDAACHARFGLTSRTKALLGAEACAYVFLVYGMHYCFNVVCGGLGQGHAVLVRAIEPVKNIDQSTNGPGKASRALGIDRRHNGASLLGDSIWLEKGKAPKSITTSARVGVSYAGNMADLPWRFFDEGSPHVSRPARKLIGRG